MARIFSLALAAMLFVVSAPVMAGGTTPSWVFQRSYYSHEPVRAVTIDRQSSGRGPYYARPTGSYVRSGWRNNRSTIRIGGMTFDHVNMYESWVQFGAQY